ncbi:hypothetical protein CPB86DRAFT_817684 [Serendipita vermifera]|nr:hypothetical protein CPB86DRAFT_817684 [Serendipita vermifera]
MKAGNTSTGSERRKWWLNSLLKRAIMDTERVHNNMEGRFRELGVYFRFNTERILSLDEQAEGMAKAHTAAYLKEEAIDHKIDEAVRSIHGRNGLKSLKEINSIVSIKLTYKQRPAVVPFFVGRSDILELQHGAHIRNPGPQGNQPVISVLTGLSGSGKTQIALQFASQFEAFDRNLLVFLVDASSEEQIKADYQAIIRSRGLTHRFSNYENAFEWFISTDKPWLIIADGADDASFNLHSFEPKCPRGHFIVTSRNANRALMAPAHTHRVEDLATANAVKLLNISGYESIEANINHATAIVIALGNLPLAVAQAAGYIYIHKCLSTYLEIYSESQKELLSRRTKELSHWYEPSVSTTLEMSFNKLPNRSKEALCVLSFLQHTSIPHSILATAGRNQFFYASGKASEADDDKLNDIRKESELLCQIFCPILLTPLNYLKGRPKILFHASPSSELATPAACSGGTALFPIPGKANALILLPHLKPFSGIPTGIATDDILLFNILSETRDVLTAYVRLTSYMELAKDRVKSDAHERQGSVWPNMGDEFVGEISRCNRERKAFSRPFQLAILYLNIKKDYSRSVEIQSKVLGIRRRLLEEGHPDTLSSMSNLGMAYTMLEKYPDAQECNEMALELHKRLLGPEHPDTILFMHRLALDYTSLNQDEKARDLLEHIMALNKRVLGPELSAKTLNEQTLRIRLKVLGTEHPSTISSFKVLARDYNKLALSRLGAEHPETIDAMENLAFNYTYLQQYDNAKDLDEQVLELRKKVFGPEHKYTLMAMSNLAEDYRNLEEYGLAQGLDEETLTLRQRTLGPEHIETLWSMENLAQDYHNLEQHQKGREFEEQLLSLRKKVLGAEHPDTIKLMNKLSAQDRGTDEST